MLPHTTAVPAGEWPKVFLIGVQKGATTSLADVFDKAGLCRSKKGKEPHYWDFNRVVCDMETTCAPHATTYQTNFQERGEKQPRWGVECVASYDATPAQLSDPDLPRFLARYVPRPLAAEVRIVAILREPASRLLSFFNAFGANGLSFEEMAQGEVTHWYRDDPVWGVPVRKYSEGAWGCDGYNGCQAHVPPLHLMRAMYDV